MHATRARAARQLFGSGKMLHVHKTLHSLQLSPGAASLQVDRMKAKGPSMAESPASNVSNSRLQRRGTLLQNVAHSPFALYPYSPHPAPIFTSTTTPSFTQSHSATQFVQLSPPSAPRPTFPNHGPSAFAHLRSGYVLLLLARLYPETPFICKLLLIYQCRPSPTNSPHHAD